MLGLYAHIHVLFYSFPLQCLSTHSKTVEALSLTAASLMDGLELSVVHCLWLYNEEWSTHACAPQAHAIMYFEDKPFRVHFNCHYSDILPVSSLWKMQLVHYFFPSCIMKFRPLKQKKSQVAQAQAFWSMNVVLWPQHFCLLFGAETTFQSLIAGPYEWWALWC